MLTHFKEPSWNNPVVRLIDTKEKALTSPVRRDWSRAKLASSMVTALRKAKRDVPPYLELLASELEARRKGPAKAVFGMA